MKKAQFSLLAKSDLQSIKQYIEKDNPKRATQYMVILKKKCDMLAQSPLIGLYRKEYCGLYQFPVGHYLIFYQLSKTGINVIRVLHGARDIKGLFKNENIN
jgi:toxin ParE1/3/4